MFFALLSVRLRTAINTLTRGERAERMRARGAIGVTLIVAFAVGSLSYGIFMPLAEGAAYDPTIRYVLAGIPTLALFTAFWLLLLSGITTGIQTFYLSAEVPLLLASPLRPRVIFLAKFVEVALKNSALFLLLGAPMLAAYGLARGTTDGGYIATSALVLLTFAALPTSLGVLATILLMRVLPAGRTRDMLGAVGVALFACMYFALSTAVNHLHHGIDATRDVAMRFTVALQSPALEHGPWYLAGSSVARNGSAGALAGRLALLTAFAIGGVWLCAAAAEAMHARGWSTGTEADADARGSARRDGRGRHAAGTAAGAGILPPSPFRAVYGKDARTIARDMGQLSMLLIPIAVVGVFLVDMAQGGPRTDMPPLVFVGILLFMLAPLSLRLAMAAFMAENRAFWVMLAAPCDPIRILIGKFGFAFTLSVILAVPATGAFAWVTRMTPDELAAALGLVLCAVAGFTGIGIGACAAFADLQAANTRFAMPTAGRLLIFGGQVAYMLVAVAIAVGAWLIVRAAAAPPALAYAIAGVLFAVTSAGVAAAPLLYGARRLRRAEW